MVTVCTTECNIKSATNNDYLPEHNSLNNMLMCLDCVPVTHELMFYEQYRPRGWSPGLLPRKFVLDSGPVCIGFVIEKVTIRLGFLLLIEFSPSSNTLPTLRAQFVCCFYQNDMGAKPRNLPIE
jgi:hypothetical protein